MSPWQRTNLLRNIITEYLLHKVKFEQVPCRDMRPTWNKLRRTPEHENPRCRGLQTRTFSEPPLAREFFLPFREKNLGVYAKTPFYIMYSLLHQIVSYLEIPALVLFRSAGSSILDTSFCHLHKVLGHRELPAVITARYLQRVDPF